ncbi:NAD(P)/FAD-dependent oxidoreductase [bacterium LRH843]|nr:NAD(P)/FAD-dependent oxidoreductase [bacterium LRH843]
MIAVEEGNENTELQRYDAVVVGGGLAGLTSAAYLTKSGKKVLLLERGNPGGRAFTLNVRGFKINYGAHAIYGRDTSILGKFESELGIKIEWLDFSPEKAKYDLGDTLTDVPANLKGLYRTKTLKGADKLKFTFEIVKTLLHAQKGDPDLSIKEWMEKQRLSDEVAETMLTLASSNFFTNEPEKIPSNVFFTYYRRLFKSKKPVAYIAGGWQSLIQEFIRVIEENGGTIKKMESVESVVVTEGKVTEVQTKEGNYFADDFVFCIPPRELINVFAETGVRDSLKRYVNYQPSYVFIYDVGLSARVDVPYTYIYDETNKIFITDISYYDAKCVPEGGQLLQAIAYLREDEIDNPEKMDEYKEKIEQLYDKHFAGWRENLVVPRVTKKAIAQEIKWVMNQQPMPLTLPEYQNLFFAGDWCEGSGQLSELSFTSAYRSSHLLLEKSLVKL